jgi:hypothetical protein
LEIRNLALMKQPNCTCVPRFEFHCAHDR